MGQELFLRSGKPATPLFSAQAMIDDPEMVVELHCDFIRAGADLISLNAYAATPERLARDADISLFEPLQKAADQGRLASAGENRKTRSHRWVPAAPCRQLPCRTWFHQKIRQYRSYERIVEQQEAAVDLFIAETLSSVAEARYVCEVVAKTQEADLGVVHGE